MLGPVRYNWHVAVRANLNLSLSTAQKQKEIREGKEDDI